jgi:monovalent cation:H+ antiporter-2, CPA2 family
MKPWLEARLGRAAPPGAAPRGAEGDIARPAAGVGSALPFPAPVADTASQRPQTAEENGAAAQPSLLSGHTVLVGFGRVGGLVGRQLIAGGVPLLIIETSSKRIVEAKNLGAEVIGGNGADATILRLANLPAAKTLFIAIPDTFEAGQIAEQARRANPRLFIIARAHSDAEVEHLTRLGADTVVMGEREIARAMIEWVRQPRPEAAAEETSLPAIARVR